jgi:uncharacterized protein
LNREAREAREGRAAEGTVAVSEQNELEVRDNQAASRYEAETEAGLALIAYRLQGDVIALTHTEVPEALEGQGVGSELVRQVLDDVRARGLRVRPLCPFVAAYITRHQEYQGLVAA